VGVVEGRKNCSDITKAELNAQVLYFFEIPQALFVIHSGQLRKRRIVLMI
jgi:hypothetical protein